MSSCLPPYAILALELQREPTRPQRNDADQASERQPAARVRTRPEKQASDREGRP